MLFTVWFSCHPEKVGSLHSLPHRGELHSSSNQQAAQPYMWQSENQELLSSLA